MEITAVIHDEKGIPYTTERFMEEPESAQEFLKTFEAFSFGYLKTNWIEWENDKLIHTASRLLGQMSRDLVALETFKATNGVQ